MGKSDFRDGQVESRVKLERNCHFSRKIGEIVPILSWKDRSPLLHILGRNYPSFYLKCPRKCQKTYNFDIFPTLFQICTSPPPKFWGRS